MTTLEHLQTAARLLVMGGFCRGTYSNEAGQHCILGAVRAVAPEYFVVPAAVYTLTDALGSHNLANWNDTPGRTKDEVLELFNYAIALEAGKVAT